MQHEWQKIIGERTLVLIKPDAMKRGLAGRIIQRFEDVGLTIVAQKLVRPDSFRIRGHLPRSKEWFLALGNNTLKSCAENRRDPNALFGTEDPEKIACFVRNQIYSYLASGPVTALVLRGPGAVQKVREMTGTTINAVPGTIRGDFGSATGDLANVVGGAIRNLIHSSATVAEAQVEIANWFATAEVLEWSRADEATNFLEGAFTKGGVA